MTRMLPVLLLLAFACVPPAVAAPLASGLFAAQPAPTAGPAAPIGGYSRGCAQGLVALPESGPYWQAMRLSRNRFWGQPAMISYLEDLGAKARAAGWNGIYVGDISQPRGGPSPSGHASHQIGLDADVWFTPPPALDLTPAQREKIGAISVRTADQRSINGNWTASHAALLRAAASDPRVDRIFVAAAIKIEMCRTATRRDRDWMQKLRPEAGHEDHFHVRLKCPPGARLCQTQKPTVKDLSNGGDGCDQSLMWWVTDYLKPPKPGPKPSVPRPHRKTSREFTMADLPAQCVGVLRQP